MKSIAYKVGLANLLPLAVFLILVILNTVGKKTDLMHERELKTRHLVEAAYGVLDYYHQQEKQGVFSGEDARKAAAATVKALRYAETGYFWINDLGTPVPKMVMHTTLPRLDGKVLDEAMFNCAISMRVGLDGRVEPTDGKMNLFVAMNTVVNKAGQGYVNYLWPKPKEGGGVTVETYPKMSFVKKFEPWGWVIGSGIYIDDIDALYRKQVWGSGFILLLLGTVLYVISAFIARGIARPISDAARAMSEIEASGDLRRRLPETGGLEAVGIARAFNKLVVDQFEKTEAIRIRLQAAKDEAEDAEGKLRDSYVKLEEANRRLQKLDQMKSDFLSSVSHELRTPLTSIRGFAHLVEREFSRSFASLAGEDAGLIKKSNRIRENLEIILKESDRLTRLVNDVLDLAKIEAGRVEWHDTPVQPGVLVHDAINAAQGMFDQKPDVELKVEIEDGLPLFVGDADRMLQVLINLFNNAAKFTDHGSVTVQAFLNPENQIQIDIIDSGIGFPPEEAEAIFDKFQQAKHGDTLEDRPRGTGLGLSISREIVERHGGKVRAQSQPGKGSVFTVLLPPAAESLVKTSDITSRIATFATEVASREANEGTSPSKDGKPKVLVVDDDVGVRDYLTQLLQEQDYDVITAADGQAAIIAAQAYHPDLITMDLAMPIMDGHTAITNLRADPELQHIPILVVSAITGWETAGGDLSMSKPLDEPRFLKNIHLLLGRSESAESKKMCFLVLYENERNMTMVPSGFIDHCEVNFCPLDELSARIQSGFQGMVVIPTDLLNKVDLSMLNGVPSLEVIIMPVQAAVRKII
jgi:signal transduction histidine kinase